MEIGGSYEFQQEKLNCKIKDYLLGDDYVFTLSGREAIDCIIKDVLSYKNVKTVLLPDYCCDSMIEPFLNNNIETIFFEVNLSRIVNLDLSKYKVDIVLFMEYFGFEQEINILNKTSEILINDQTHSFFQSNKKNISDYDIISFRKWMPLLVGCAVKRKGSFINIHTSKCEQIFSKVNNARKMKLQYQDNNKCVEKSVFLNMFSEVEVEISNYQRVREPETINFCININDMIKKRKENSLFLIEEISKINDNLLFYKELKKNDVPLFIPLNFNGYNRSKFRNYMISKSIFLPIHWPKSKCIVSKNDLYDNEISIVCDHRYNLKDMKCVIDSIKEWMK